MRAMISRWMSNVFGDASERAYPMILVDEADEVDYALAGDDVPELKSFIWHDGSDTGRRQAERMAKDLARHGRTVRYLDAPGIVGMCICNSHLVIERRLAGVTPA